ncbi:MAG TPA: hypothetical protein VJ729_06045 [Nitrososphaeraceae archaeon]|nr:hypothetical protein [Nitrososphaeraceae archaeon]
MISRDIAALAQTPDNYKSQEWIDQESNVKILFSYDPQSPVIGKATKLMFEIQDLRTGAKIKEGLDARLIITNGRNILKIIKSAFTEGNFSINYAFTDAGTYQVISKLDSKNYSELASFNVFVPTGASNVSRTFVSLMLYYVIPATSSAAGIVMYLSHKKKI